MERGQDDGPAVRDRSAEAPRDAISLTLLSGRKGAARESMAVSTSCRELSRATERLQARGFPGKAWWRFERSSLLLLGAIQRMSSPPMIARTLRTASGVRAISRPRAFRARGIKRSWAVFWDLTFDLGREKPWNVNHARQ